MKQHYQSKARFFSVLLLISIAGIITVMALGLNPNSTEAQAQEPLFTKTATPRAQTVNTIPVVDARQQEARLGVVQFPSSLTVTAGSPITFNVRIFNYGEAENQSFYFRHLIYDELQNPKWSFDDPNPESITYPSQSSNEKLWKLSQPLALDDSTNITITGILTSIRSVKVTNLVEAYTDERPNPASETIEIEVYGEVGFAGPVYIPMMVRQPTHTPTPTPTATNTPSPTMTPSATPTGAKLLYHDDFQDENRDPEWGKGLDNENRCNSEYNGGRYVIEADKGGGSTGKTTCWRSSPGDADEDDDGNLQNIDLPYFEYGAAEVSAYHSDGESDAAYAMYINGRGGDNMYLLRLWPNVDEGDDDDAGDCRDGGGDWEFYRVDDGESKVLSDGSCDKVINQGMGPENMNVMKIEHKENGLVAVYINGTRVYNFIEDDKFDGVGTGVYARTDDDKDIIVKFDDFKVYEDSQ